MKGNLLIKRDKQELEISLTTPLPLFVRYVIS